jgi:hypothetical protein
VTDVPAVAEVLRHATTPPKDRSLLAFLVHRPLQQLQDLGALRRVKRAFRSAEAFDEFRETFSKLRTLQAQVTFYRALKRLMGVWRVFHVALAVGLVVMIAAHIGLSLFLGYKWIF